MTTDQQQIIDKLSEEISKALIIRVYMESCGERVVLLRDIRTQLEDEFTLLPYDPR